MNKLLLLLAFIPCFCYALDFVIYNKDKTIEEYEFSRIDSEGNIQTHGYRGSLPNKSVLGEYERTLATGHLNYPSRIVGHFRNVCTGTLIGPRHILTAGHCVYSFKKKSFKSRFIFKPGRIDKENSPFGTIQWEHVITLKKFIEGEGFAYDMAMVILSEPIGEKLGWAAIRETKNLSQIKIMGYPGDKPRGTMWQVECPVEEVDKGIIRHKCDTYGGMSGSGIQMPELNNDYVTLTGVHVFGGDKSNGAVALTHEKLAVLQEWLKLFK
ncbi:MAG: trypsin-like serine peptidase [Bacteriovoracaceae bacterium]